MLLKGRPTKEAVTLCTGCAIALLVHAHSKKHCRSELLHWLGLKAESFPSQRLILKNLCKKTALQASHCCSLCMRTKDDDLNIDDFIWLISEKKQLRWKSQGEESDANFLKNSIMVQNDDLEQNQFQNLWWQCKCFVCLITSIWLSQTNLVLASFDLTVVWSMLQGANHCRARRWRKLQHLLHLLHSWELIMFARMVQSSQRWCFIQRRKKELNRNSCHQDCEFLATPNWQNPIF